MKTIKQKIQKQVLEARKSRNEVKKNILNLLLGEIGSEESRGNDVDDSKIIKMAQKIIKNNTETYNYSKDENLLKENSYLEDFIPKSLTLEEMEEQISDEIKQKVVSVKQGPAMGMVIGFFKSKGLMVEPKNVNSLVSILQKDA